MPTALAINAFRRLEPPPALDLNGTALFADLDGTLAPIEPLPSDVGPDVRRMRLLDRLSDRLGARLAVISGRALDDLDRVLSGGVTCVAAVHGLVRRRADGGVVASGGKLSDAARTAILELGRSNPALLLEDKGAAIALHYRNAPQTGEACKAEAERLAQRFDLEVKPGQMVIELRRRGPNKADAVAAFMSEPPFAGAKPVFLGDDLTDEDGFFAAYRLGGFGVVVGARRPTLARYALPGVEAALAWLEGALEPAS
jgi:trehalose 6-phosphate phosphatase